MQQEEQTSSRIIVVTGQSGVGKTHLCRELIRRGLMCIDTDDIVRQVRRRAHGHHGHHETFEQLLHTRVHSHKIVIVAGMYHIPESLFPNIVKRLALRPDPRKIGATYRQYLLRNLDNVTRYARDIRAAIESTRLPKDIQHSIGHNVMINADLVMSFDVFKEHVDAAAAHYRKRGYSVMTQDAALKAILDIASHRRAQAPKVGRSDVGESG